MERATRADAVSTAPVGAPADVAVPERPVPPVPGAGIGLPQIRSTTAPPPAAVPSLEDLVADEPARPAPDRPTPGVTVPDGPVTPESFPPGVAAKLGTYVYLLTDPRTGRPFFVGTGRGDRCHRHVHAARTLPSDDAGRSKYPLLDRIREAESHGRRVRVEVLRHGLTPTEADLVQA